MNQVNFGGHWTEQKLETFVDYVKAYLKILNRNKQKYNWETIYFDGFAGFGNAVRPADDLDLLFNIENDQDRHLYKGSVTRILELQKPYLFDYYYFIDLDKSKVDIIEKFKSNVEHIKPNRIIARSEDCNGELKKLARALNSNKYAALVFLDPFGMQVRWESIATLKDTRSDIWILIPSGVAINRLITKNGLRNKDKLEAFFGLSEKDILSYFYKEKQVNTLFDWKTEIKKIPDPVNKIAELYISQLKSIWKEVTPQPLVLKNSKNSPIFHLLFASNNSAGLKIASNLIERKNR